MLAQGFGLPVIGPATDALRDHVADNHDLLYDPQAPRGLLRNDDAPGRNAGPRAARAASGGV